MSKENFLTNSSSSSASDADNDDDDELSVVNEQQSPSRPVFTPNGDQILELHIESLLGTSFEVRLPAKTQVGSIKSRLQRNEGIPKHHLHLVYKGSELADELSLRDCGVKSGEHLSLVLAMRGGPINTRRVPLPSSSKPAQQDIQSLMLKNKDQILEKMPKNGQVTVLLFREGDKVNVYHVLEKPDGSYTPLTTNSNPNSTTTTPGSGKSFKKLLEQHDNQDSDPDLKRRLQENAVTMTKMAELRKQMENLNMGKKLRQRRLASNTRGSAAMMMRPKSTKRSRSKQSKISSNASSVNANGNSKTFKKSNPLPPIHGYHNAGHGLVDGANGFILDDDFEEEDYCTIMPLSDSTNSSIRRPNNLLNSRKQSLSRLYGNGNSHLNSSGSSKVPDWLNKNHGKAFPMRRTRKHTGDHHLHSQSRMSTLSRMSSDENTDNDAYNPGGGGSKKVGNRRRNKPSKGTTKASNSGNCDFDLVDLQFRPENSSLEIVKHRKTQKLVSADMSSFAKASDTGVNANVSGSQTSLASMGNQGGVGNRTRLQLSSSDSSPRTKAAEQRRKWIKAKNEASLMESSKDLEDDDLDDLDESRPLSQSTMPFSESRDSLAFTSVTEESNVEQLYLLNRRRKIVPVGQRASQATAGSRQSSARTGTANSNGRRNSGHRPKFIAKPMSSNPIKHPVAKRKSNKTRCSECRKKVNITNMFTCRCELIFCPKHRHPEIHGCTFDYKTEGRRQLEEANPVVVLPKLPKL